MSVPITKLLVELPAVDAARACIFLYEKCNAYWADELTPEDEEALRAAIKRKEGGDDAAV